jgi:hypothetical protein
MKRCLTLMLIALITLGCATAALAAWPANFEGKPNLMRHEPTDAYFIWHDRDGVHIRVTSKEDSQVFTGSITTDGKLENIMVKSTGNRDYSRLIDNGKLNFRLTAADNPAGIDFSIIRGETVKFNLEIDGQRINPSQIFVGAEGWNPGDSRFSICYNEEDHEDQELEHDSHTTVIIGFDWFWWLFGGSHGHGHCGHGPGHCGPGHP